jgi:thioredoxin-related protein
MSSKMRQEIRHIRGKRPADCETHLTRNRQIVRFFDNCSTLEEIASYSPPDKITMKKNTLIATLALSFATLTSAFAGGEGWVTDFEAAKKSAAEGKKDLLLDFTGSDWCGWCIKLNEEVFSKEPFKAGTKDKFVMVELDFPRKKELDAKLKEQNEALQEKFQIQGFPTIMLCDATGKPYAKTGYQPGGPEKYVAHLDELQAVRVKRDEAFAKADAAKTDVEKAAFLVEGLKALDEELVDSCYSDVVDKIGALDKEDKSGFVKARKEAAAKKEAEEAAMASIQEFMGTKIQPLMQAKEYDKALEAVKTFIKDNPNTPEDYKIGMTLNIGLAGPMEKGNVEAAHAMVDGVAKDYPNSDVAKNVDKIKASIKARLDQQKAAGGGEE